MKFYFNVMTAIIIFLIAATAFAQPVQTDSLSLNQAIKMAITNQPLVQQAEEQIYAAEAKTKQQKTFYLPNVEGDVSYTRIGPIPSFAFGGSVLDLAPANNYDAHVIASQLLYDFGKRDALVELSKSFKLSSQDKVKLIQNNLAYQTARAFYTIIFLEKSIQVKDEQLNTLNKHIEIAMKKVQSGSATDFDVLTTKVRVAAVQNQKIDLENSLAKAKIYLKSLMGWPSGKELKLTGQFTVNSLNLNSEDLINEAFSKRPELKLAEDAEKSAVLNKQVISLEDKPMVNLIASYGLKNGFEPNLDVLRGNWAAGINAQIPIFNGNLKDAKLEEADANIKTSSIKILELRRNIKADVEQAVADINSGKAKIETAKLQVAQATEAVSRAQIQYQNGVITNLDLIDAETSLTEAELQYVQVLYNNVLNSYELDQALGNKTW